MSWPQYVTPGPNFMDLLSVFSGKLAPNVADKSVINVSIYPLNLFTSGILDFFPIPRAGLFSVKIRKTFLAIKNFSVNEMMSGQPNKRLIH